MRNRSVTSRRRQLADGQLADVTTRRRNDSPTVTTRRRACINCYKKSMAVYQNKNCKNFEIEFDFADSRVQFLNSILGFGAAVRVKMWVQKH